MKDPLQPGRTPYEILGLPAGAAADEIDRAFRTRLAGSREVQKLTAARRALQDPQERPLIDLFLLSDRVLGTLSPSALSDPSALAPPRRWATLRAWDAQLRARFPDPDLLQTMGVVWFWGALHCEGDPGCVAGDAPPLREQWERAIACWTALAAHDAYWVRYPAGGAVRNLVIERLRGRLQDCEQPYRDRGELAGAELYQELEEALDTELQATSPAAPVAANGQMLAVGPLMAHFVASDPGTPASSPVARVRTLLRRGNPQAAAQAFASMSESERLSDEGRDLGADVYHAIGRELASLDKTDEALGAWAQAIDFGETHAKPDVQRDVEELCQARAAALQRVDRQQARRILQRGMKLAPSFKLRDTLAELLTQDGIERINTVYGAYEKSGEVSPATLAAVEEGWSELHSAAGMGWQRAADQLDLAASLLVRLRWSRRTVASVEFNDLPRAVRERFTACAREEQTPRPVHATVDAAPRSASAGWILATIGAVALFSLSSVEWGVNSPLGYHSVTALIGGYVPLVLGLLWGVRWALRHREMVNRFPFRTGRYLFPVGFIDARTSLLRIVPFARLKEITPESTQHDVKLKLVVDETETHEVHISFGPAAKAVFDGIEQGATAERDALRSGDTGTLHGLDPLADLVVSGTPLPSDSPADAAVCIVRPMSEHFLWSVAAAVVAALLLGTMTWAVRNFTSDTQRYASARATGTVASLRRYVAIGGRFEDEARAAMAPMALSEARKAGTVAAFRSVTKEFPNTPEATTAQSEMPGVALAVARKEGTVTGFRNVVIEFPNTDASAQARAEVSKLYNASFAAFRTAARATDGRIVSFMRRLLEHLERHEQAVVNVRFRPPTVAAAVREELGGSDAERREKGVFNRLNEAFGKIFKADVLRLTDAGRVTNVSEARRAAPLMLIQYNISTQGSYVLESTSSFGSGIGSGIGSGRRFFGIIVAFTVTLTIPDAEETFSFPLVVTPPSSFSVGSNPSSGSVYDTMAARAFDQLNSKLETVFFGRSSGSMP